MLKLLRNIMPLVFLLSMSALYAMPSRNPMGNCDDNGFARYGNFEFPMFEGDTLRLFYLEFNTNPQIEPAAFGAFWHMPALSSKVELVGSDELKWFAPNGRSYYFCSHSTERRKGGGLVFTDNTGIWHAVKEKNRINIKSARDASVYTYENGRLIGFRLRDESEYFITYAGNTRNALSVKNKTGLSLLSFEYHSDRRHVKSIKTYRGVYSFDFHPDKSNGIIPSDRQFSGVMLLGRFSTPDGKDFIRQFEYGSVPVRPRMLFLKDLSEISVLPSRVNRMEMKLGASETGWIEWCGDTGIIMSDNGGEYAVGNSRADSLSPNFDANRGQPPYIGLRYMKSGMKYPQINLFDYENFYEIKGSSLSGTITRNSKIGVCGPLKLRTRKEERLDGEVSNGKWNLVRSFSYDNEGRIIREIDSFGNNKQYLYSQEGNCLSKDILYNNQLVLSEKFIDGRLSEFTRYASDGSIQSKKYAYDDLNGLIREAKYSDGKFIYEKVYKGRISSSTLIRMKDANGVESLYRYNGKARESLVLYPGGEKILSLYDFDKKTFNSVKDIGQIMEWAKALPQVKSL